MAVKQLKQHDARNDMRFLREIAILKECRSGHVVQFLVRLPPAVPQWRACGSVWSFCHCSQAFLLNGPAASPSTQTTLSGRASKAPRVCDGRHCSQHYPAADPPEPSRVAA